MAVSNQPPNGTRKSLTGFITKLVGDGGTFGFINDEIFFQQDVVVGGPVALNDRVFADCEYSENLPIKWNATSIKILQRAGASPGSQGGNTGAQPTILDSDPRRRQGLLNQQDSSLQQPPFNQPPAQPVANTYQQHRQQRQQQQQQQQQQQILRPFEPPNPTDASSLGGHQQPLRLLEQSNVVGPEFFPNQPFVQPVASQALDIPPFQQPHDTPMGPPKITYTSQLGAAFVQGQAPMVPPPFLSQSTTAPSSIPPNQQQRVDSRNKQNRFNANNQTSKVGDGRRDQDGRNRVRNDGNRSDHQSRNQDRDRRAQNEARNYSSRSDASSRDRSGGRNTSPKRDKSSRSSPPSHHPVTSRTSVSSERSGSHLNSKTGSRRHYEPYNIPKSMILTDLNGSNMRSRCSSTIHVPSDLKDVIVNKFFRLDLKNIPKPITYKIEESTKTVESKTEVETTKSEQSDNTQQQSIGMEAAKENESSENTNDSVEIKKEISESSLATPPSSQPKSDVKLNHKYGVKVILISLPEQESIYKNIFGTELDSYSNDSSRTRSRVDKYISLLCNKGSNGGHSLIGGKFDPVLDGFVEGEQNEFERYGRQPDLIATCRRVVLEQTGLDLGPCKGWSLLSTFLYNNKSDYFSNKASIEYSYIYMPQIWTMTTFLDKSAACENTHQVIEKEILDHKNEASELSSTGGSIQEEKYKEEQLEEHVNTYESKSETEGKKKNSVEMKTENDADKTESNTVPDQVSNAGSTIENLAELKVVDLKLELDKRNVKYKPNAKKAELVSLLDEHLQMTNSTKSGQEAPASVNVDCMDDEQVQSGQSTATDVDDGLTKPDQADKANLSESNDSTVEAEEESDDTKMDSDEQVSAQTDQVDSVPSNKRKAIDDAENDNKESRKDSQVEEESQEREIIKKQKFEILKEPFVVKAREGQQLVLVSLYDVVQVMRYDQFELSVTSNLLKESLVQHFSEYIFTTLVEGNRTKWSLTESRITATNGSTSGSLSSGSVSQENNSSDTNNNTNNKSLGQETISKTVPNEFPVDRYINLACAYFDSTHMGYLHADDLSKLFCNTGLTISRRALISLIGDNEKFSYRTVAEITPRLPPTYVYTFPEQFRRLPGQAKTAAGDENELKSTLGSEMIEYQGVKYDLASLVEQVRELESTRVNMVERFNHAIENFDKQVEEIHLLKVNQNSLTTAIKAQNDEISDLKRERESLKKKLDNLRKGIKSSVSSLSDLVNKDDK